MDNKDKGLFKKLKSMFSKSKNVENKGIEAVEAPVELDNIQQNMVSRETYESVAEQTIPELNINERRTISGNEDTQSAVNPYVALNDESVKQTNSMPKFGDEEVLDAPNYTIPEGRILPTFQNTEPPKVLMGDEQPQVKDPDAFRPIFGDEEIKVEEPKVEVTPVEQPILMNDEQPVQPTPEPNQNQPLPNFPNSEPEEKQIIPNAEPNGIEIGPKVAIGDEPSVYIPDSEPLKYGDQDMGSQNQQGISR